MRETELEDLQSSLGSQVSELQVQEMMTYIGLWPSYMFMYTYPNKQHHIYKKKMHAST